MKMNQKHTRFPLKPVLTMERNICRVIAAWSLYALFTLLTSEGDFYKLSFAQDQSLGLMVLVIGILFCGMTAIAAVLAEYETDTWFLLLGATGCVIRWLAVYEISINNTKMNSDETLFLLAVIAVYLLFVFYFLQRNRDLFDKLRVPTWFVWVVVGIVGVFAAVISASIASWRFLSLSSPNFDLGIFAQMFHNMLKTGIPNTTCERDVLLSHFAVHFTPMCYTILPIYAIYPSAVTLQIVQSVVLVSGIIPAVLLARHLKLSWRSQLLVGVIYSFYPAITTGCFYDFHENFFMLPLLLWLFYFYECEKYLQVYIFAFLTLMVKEDAAIYVVFFALYALLNRRSKKSTLHGCLVGLMALAYFGITMAYLDCTAEYWRTYYQQLGETPSPTIDGPMTYRYSNLIFNKEDGLLGVILTALKNPGYLLTELFSTNGYGLDSHFFERSPWAKLVYALHMLLPIGMIPFVTKKQSRWVLLTPILLNMLTYYTYQYSIRFQYNFGITAFLIYAMIINLPDLKPMSRRHLLSVGAVAACCMYIFYVLPMFGHYHKQYENDREKNQAILSMLDTIPEDASVSVPGIYVAHMSDRQEVYENNYHINYWCKNIWKIEKEKGDIREYDVDYVVLTKADVTYLKIMKKNGYTVWAEYDGHFILKSPHVD